MPIFETDQNQLELQKEMKKTAMSGFATAVEQNPKSTIVEVTPPATLNDWKDFSRMFAKREL